MASNTMVIRFAVFLAVISSMAIAANGQGAAAPAPPPSTGGATTGASMVPSIVAPALALFVTFCLGRKLW